MKRKNHMRTGKEKNNWSRTLLACAIALACFSVPQLKAAEIVCPPRAEPKAGCMDDKLQMRIGIPLWAPGLNGDITVGQEQGHIHKDFSSFFDRVDFIAPISIELRKSRFFFSADGAYMKTHQSVDSRGIFAAPGSTADMTLKQVYGNIDFGYELLRQPCYSLTAYIGARMAYLNPKLSINSPGLTATRSTERFYGDPTIGLYGTYDFADWFGLYVKGDVGGFGVLNDHFTWAAQPGAEFRPSPHTYLRAGWHWLSLDIANRDNFNFNATLGGPQLEFGWRF